MNNTQKNETKHHNSARMFYEITAADFSTNRPNIYRIEKIARGLDDYLKFKSKFMRSETVSDILKV